MFNKKKHHNPVSLSSNPNFWQDNQGLAKVECCLQEGFTLARPPKACSAGGPACGEPGAERQGAEGLCVSVCPSAGWKKERSK